MARIIADFGQRGVVRDGQVLQLSVFGMDCGCTIEVDLRGYMMRNSPLRDLLERTAQIHDCNIVVRDGESRPQGDFRTWPLVPTYMGMPISSGPERVLREFYAEVRAPAIPTRRPAVGFHPDQLKGLSVTSIIVDEVADYPAPTPKKSEIKPDRFDLIEID